MIDANENVLRAFISLQGTPAWETILTEWFRPSVTEATEFGGIPESYRLGAVWQINDILVKIENAKKDYEKVMERNNAIEMINQRNLRRP